MRCLKCQKLYDDAVQGALSEKQNHKVRDHLASCPACSVFWQENEALRSTIRQSATPAVMPDAAYFARLARQAISKAQAEETEERSKRPEARGLLAAMAGLLTGLRFGVAGLARAATFLALGILVGLALSPGFRQKMHEKVLSSGIASLTPRSATSSEAPLVERGLPPDMIAKAGPFAAPPEVGDPGRRSDRMILKRDELGTPSVDPASLVEAWQKTVALLDKMGPSDEVERLRQIQQVSRRVPATTVLSRLQDLKLQLVRDGQTDYLADVHQIEDVFRQLAAVSRDREASDFAHLDTYQKAEEALIKKRYDEAMRLFQMVRIQAPGSYLAARATHQIGNISFEYFRDYKNGYFEYNQCLDSFARHFPDAIRNQMHERVDLITQNSMDNNGEQNYAPLRMFFEAESATQPATGLALHLALLKQYPQSPLMEKTIAAMTRIVRQAADDTSAVNQALDALDQFQDQNPNHPLLLNVQLAVADITNFCVRNRSQAVLEYTRILEKAKDPEMIKTVQGRLRLLERQR